MPPRSRKQAQVITVAAMGRMIPVTGRLTPMGPDMDADCIELRFVVTPDLDGKQLQYRCWAYPSNRWGKWKPVHTVFVNHKLKEKKPK